MLESDFQIFFLTQTGFDWRLQGWSNVHHQKALSCVLDFELRYKMNPKLLWTEGTKR